MTPLKFKTISELKHDAKKILTEIKAGEQVVITLNGRPLAVISRAKEEEFEIVKGKK